MLYSCLGSVTFCRLKKLPRQAKLLAALMDNTNPLAQMTRDIVPVLPIVEPR